MRSSGTIGETVDGHPRLFIDALGDFERGYGSLGRGDRIALFGLYNSRFRQNEITDEARLRSVVKRVEPVWVSSFDV